MGLINFFISKIKSLLRSSPPVSAPANVVPFKKKKKQRKSQNQRKKTNKRARAREEFWSNYRGDMSCGYCKQTTSRLLPEDHPLKATVEHIVPISQGGSNRRKNMMLSCFECNQLESTKKQDQAKGDEFVKVRLKQRKLSIQSKYYGTGS